jgi:hypothetical protein
MHGTLQRFEKLKSSSFTPQAFAWIKATYPSAIEYAGQKQSLEGGIMIGVFLFGPLISIGWMGLLTVAIAKNDWVIWLLSLFAIPAFCMACYWITLFPLRHVWRTPRDLPIIFDRAHRKVYRMAQQVEPGLRGLIKPWPVKALCYEWDLIDAEHNSELVSSPNLARRLHRLIFVVRKSADDPTIIDSFEIGNGMAQGEEMIAPMYEHIRRFMEERGPHLPNSDEPLDERNEDLPTWWQACGRAGPWGNNYWYWWKEHWPMAVLHHVLVGTSFAILYWFHLHGSDWIDLFALGFAWTSLSMVWGQGTGIWLMAHTSYMLDWPRAVHDAIGKPLRKGVGW